ncbi:MAG: hypothetical protein CL678_09135 [Bdellovibrionaceae bacterium]|nr:hypothetical protein [Pseudobdellovibrionaceae bacterium]
MFLILLGVVGLGIYGLYRVSNQPFDSEAALAQSTQMIPIESAIEDLSVTLHQIQSEAIDLSSKDLGGHLSRFLNSELARFRDLRKSVILRLGPTDGSEILVIVARVEALIQSCMQRLKLEEMTEALWILTQAVDQADHGFSLVQKWSKPPEGDLDLRAEYMESVIS